MSAEENKALTRRLFEEGLNQNKPAVIDELLDPNFVLHDAPFGMPSGPESFRQFIPKFREAFPDLRVNIESEWAVGDTVFHRGYLSGTHRGNFQGIAATGNPINVKYLDIWRVANGKLVENWVQMDLLGLMQQLGAVPAPKPDR